MRLVFLTLAFAAVLAGVCGNGLAQESRGDLFAVEASTVEIESLLAEGERYALIIANEAYDDPRFPALRNPHDDATAIAALFESEFGFRTTIEVDGETRSLMLFDAGLRDIDRAMSLLSARLEEADSLVIYYAGHGIWDEERQLAAWLPRDAENGLMSTMFTSELLQRHLGAMRAHKVLVISDSCYAGRFLRSVDVASPFAEGRAAALLKSARDRSRVFIAAGNTEPVLDGGGYGGRNSIFADALLSGLSHIDEQVFSAQELFLNEIQPVVGTSAQKPLWAQFERSTGHEGGDFIFARLGAPSGAPRQGVMAQPRVAAEPSSRHFESLIAIESAAMLERVLLNNHLSQREAEAIVASLYNVRPGLDLVGGSYLRILFGPSRDGQSTIPYRVSIYDPAAGGAFEHAATVALTDRGIYVLAAAPTPMAFPEVFGGTDLKSDRNRASAGSSD